MLSGDVKMRPTSIEGGGSRGAALLFMLLSAGMLVLSAGANSQTPSHSKTAPSPRIDLRPKLVPGEGLRYQVHVQTITDTKRTRAISDPQGPCQPAVTLDATITL